MRENPQPHHSQAAVSSVLREQKEQQKIRRLKEERSRRLRYCCCCGCGGCWDGVVKAMRKRPQVRGSNGRSGNEEVQKKIRRMGGGLEEELGTIKAVAVAKSWSRCEAVFCYVV